MKNTGEIESGMHILDGLLEGRLHSDLMDA